MTNHLQSKPKHKMYERRSSDVIRPILKRFEVADGETLVTANDVVTLRIELRTTYKVVRELENEVSAKRWNELAAHDQKMNQHVEAYKADNVLMFPERQSHE